MGADSTGQQSSDSLKPHTNQTTRNIKTRNDSNLLRPLTGSLAAPQQDETMPETTELEEETDGMQI